MPQLPDLTAKVKLSFADLELAAAKAKLLGDALQNELGGSKAADVDRSMKTIGTSVEDAGRKLSNAGTAFVKWGESGEAASVRIRSATARTKADFDELERRTRSLGSTLDTEFKKGTSAVIKLGDDGSAALGNVSRSMVALQNAGTAAKNPMLVLLGVLGPLGTAIAAVVIVGAPLIPLLAGTAVVLGAFAIGLAATMALVGGFAIAALGLGAAMVLLADKAGAVAGPMAKLKADASGAADALGKQAAPAAALILGFLDSLIPKLQAAGSQLIAWFGPRLPALLKDAGGAVDIVLGSFEKLGKALSPVFDAVQARSPGFLNLFQRLADFGVGAIAGLAQNLLRLSDWFITRLPVMGPIVASIFDKIGMAVQWLGHWAGVVVDWFLAHWPQIASSAQSVYGAIAAGFKILQPVFDTFKQAWIELAPYFQYIKDHAENLRPILIGLGIVFGAIVVVLATVGVGIVLLVAGLVWLGGKLGEAVAQWVKAGKDIGDTMSRVGVIARQYQTDIGNVFSAVGGFLHTAVLQYQQAGRDIGSVFSEIGSGARGMSDAVGAAFSRLGGAVHGGLESARGVFNSFIGKLDSVLGNFGINISPIPGFAAGGVVPGYSPGNDSVLAALSPGEGVLTPQTVRGLGGVGAIEALNRSGGALHGLGAAISDMSNLGSMVGSIMGQCVVAVEKWTGRYFPVAMASQMTAWINSRTPVPGSIFVSTLPPFGHTGIYLGANRVIDSNWGLDERVRIHALSDIPSIAGYITGAGGSLGNLGGALAGMGNLLGALLQPLLAPLVGAAHGAAGLIPETWVRGFANSVIDKVAGSIQGRAGGGPVVPGHLYTVGEQGPELFSSSSAGTIHSGDALSRLESAIEKGNDLVARGNQILEQINGAPQLTRRDASRRYAT